MRWAPKVTIACFLLIAAASLHFLLPKRKIIPINVPSRTQYASPVRNPRPDALRYRSIQSLWNSIAGNPKGTLSSVIPPKQNSTVNPEPGRISFQPTRSAEHRMVQTALAMIAQGEYSDARELLKAGISRSSRGRIYLEHGRPDRIFRPADQNWNWIEGWRYDHFDGVGRPAIVEFVSKPADRLSREPDPADPQAGASALWTLAYSFYREGGFGNYRKAAEQFQDFGTIFPNAREDLVQAAQLDIAVIDMDLMQSAPTIGLRIVAANEAAQTLKSFLSRWPNDPQAFAARAALIGVQGFIANPR